MHTGPRHLHRLPESQQAVHAKCTHPTGPFCEFEERATEQSIPDRFEQQVRRYHDHLAIETGNARLDYRALNATANRVAAAITGSRTTSDQPIAILLGQGPDFVATMLGVLKAGHFYVPLDPAYPRSRLTHMLEDSQAVLLMTNRRHFVFAHKLVPSASQVLDIDQLPTHLSSENPGRSIPPDDLACLIYTSGSTGQPKGVMHTHRTLLHMTRVATNALHICSEDRVVFLYSPSFLAATRAICLAMCNGAALFPFNIEEEGLPHLGRWLTDRRITVYYSIPTVFRHFVRTLRDETTLPSIRLIWLSGEYIDQRDVALYRKHFAPECVLVPFFGAAETPGPVLLHFIDKEIPLSRNSLPLGYVAEGAEVLLCDENGEEVGYDRTGEIAVKSRYLALGYWRQPQLTRAVFRPDPAGTEARIYHTGDLGRRLSDGAVEYRGRKDWQVKIRGYRIEVAEVERALLEMPAIAEAVVLPWTYQERDTRLVAYLVPAQDASVTVSETRRFLKSKLPQYMVPSVFVLLPALPLTPSGKIDRRALPSPELAVAEREEPYVAPRTPIEQQVAAAWSDLLGVSRIGVHDNFFELGGDSLQAMELLSGLSDATHVEASLRSFFETPTVASLAHCIEMALQDGPRQQSTAMAKVPREGPLLASRAQEQIWIVDQVFQGLPLFNIIYAVRLRGLCDRSILRQSCEEIIRRHEALRTSFAAVGGQLVQVVTPIVTVPMTVVDLCALPREEREPEARRLAGLDAGQPFDLQRAPLVRLRLLHIDEQEHLLLVTMHHIIADGWSLGVFAHELAVLYDALSAHEPSPLPELRIQYADFAHWQRQWRGNDMMALQLAYWQDRLADPLPVLELPTAHPRGAALSFRTARETRVLPEKLLEALIGLSHRDGCTLFMTLLAGFKMLLYGYTGQHDVCVATHTANRNQRATDELIGLFLNTVILRSDLRGNPTCQEVLQRVRATALGAYAHQDLPFEELVHTLERERGVKPSSLCQVMMIMQNAIQRPLQGSARTLKWLEFDLDVPIPPLMVSAFDIVLILRERQQGLTVSAIYKENLFDAPTINRMLGDFQQVLESLIDNPGQPLSSVRSLLDDRSHGP